ncbi:hypothetical protein L484_017606 [Morus notabilis]|uniref:Uncharacterized protein n=1 Tax=Morus notabilis TaxID=981085 RepID=W9R063_9ROSA|nr:hypothetical protein L484_017606 [Morus notabilis]
MFHPLSRHPTRAKTPITQQHQGIHTSLACSEKRDLSTSTSISGRCSSPQGVELCRRTDVPKMGNQAHTEKALSTTLSSHPKWVPDFGLLKLTAKTA